MKLLRLLYKPFALLAGLIAKRLGRSLFKRVWAKIDDKPPPPPTAPGSTPSKVIGAAALEAATMAATRAAVDHAGARSFHYLVGVWPEDKPKPENDE